MSGHSKWSTIKRQKEKTDAKRGFTFTKLSNAITIAVKQGGGVADPNQNFRLRLAMDSARALNMPKENIERAIQRAVKKDTGDLEEVIYEGFAPGGVSVIIEAVTDNSLRTTSEIKSLFNKSGASFGQPGSVSYQFSQIGEIEIEKTGKTFDEIFAIAAEDGAEDVEDLGDSVVVYTEISSLGKIRNALSDQGLKILSASLSRKPNITVEVGDKEKLGKIKSFLDTLDSMDDVQNVYSNLVEV
ncbi:MAG: YebC/PmpR family DNA-binding transcriptional regulator [Patescibacteria group bacterium]